MNPRARRAFELVKTIRKIEEQIETLTRQKLSCEQKLDRLIVSQTDPSCPEPETVKSDASAPPEKPEEYVAFQNLLSKVVKPQPKPVSVLDPPNP